MIWPHSPTLFGVARALLGGLYIVAFSYVTRYSNVVLSETKNIPLDASQLFRYFLLNLINIRTASSLFYSIHVSTR